MTETTTGTSGTDEQAPRSAAATAWDEVGDRLGALGLKLKYHAEQAAGEERSTFTDALSSLSTSIDRAFEALRAAAKDPALKDDVKSVGSALADAVSDTLSGVGDEIRKTLKHG